MLNKTLKLRQRYDELTKLVMDPEIIADNKQWKKLVKERSGLEELANTRDELELVMKHLEDAEELLH